MCLYLGGSSQHVASLYTGMLLLELIPGATRPSTDINNNNINIITLFLVPVFLIYGF